MALPWAEATPASKVDTLATTSIDGVSRNLTQVINDGGEKLLQYLAERGRIFVVPDSDRYSHPLLHADGGSATVAYRRDNFGAGASLSAESAEILTQAKFDVVFRSRNLNFPQDMPLQGNPVSYMDALVMSNAIGMFYSWSRTSSSVTPPLMVLTRLLALLTRATPITTSTACPSWVSCRLVLAWSRVAPTRSPLPV